MSKQPLVIHGKTYPLWQQFIDQREEWIGGQLVDDDDPGESTVIIDVRLTGHSDGSAAFTIEGEDFHCAFNVKYGGVGGDQPADGGIHFVTQFGGFTIRKRSKTNDH